VEEGGVEALVEVYTATGVVVFVPSCGMFTEVDDCGPNTVTVTVTGVTLVDADSIVPVASVSSVQGVEASSSRFRAIFNSGENA